MRERFTDRRFSAASLAIIETTNEICADYRRQGYNLTLRQIYYQFVARALIANSDKSYKRLGSVVNDARLAGLLDWSYVKDRTREVNGGYTGWDDPGAYIAAQAEHYYEALWAGQDNRPEVWVEKDALKDVIGQACRQFRVPYFSCRGYVSQTAMYDAAKRIEQRWAEGLTPVIIHLGDHDPSGIDMTRDIQERLSLMSGSYVEVQRIALNMDQIERYNPPRNPTKLTDSRGSSYLAEYGDSSWELDALEPRVLTSLITDAIDAVLDRVLFDAAVDQENERTEQIVEVATEFDRLRENWDEVMEVLER